MYRVRAFRLRHRRLIVRAANGPDQGQVTIAIGTAVRDASQAHPASLPIYLACWKNAGLDITLQPTKAITAMQAVLSGQAAMVNTNPAAAIIARTKGPPAQR